MLRVLNKKRGIAVGTKSHRLASHRDYINKISTHVIVYQGSILKSFGSQRTTTRLAFLKYLYQSPVLLDVT